MESLNQTLFLLLNAPANAGTLSVAFAWLCGEGLIWLLPLMLSVGWWRGDAALRRCMLEVLFAAMLALVVNLCIGALWPHPRPFVLGLGRRLIEHAADPSFPSDHVTLMSVTAVSLYLQGWRRSGALWGGMALLTAWARVYLGVHFPFDMLGAVVVAYLVARLCRQYGGVLLDPLHAWLQQGWQRDGAR